MAAPRVVAVAPEDLHKILATADKIVVKASPTSSSAILFESTDKKDLEDLWESLALELPSEWFHCMCDGTPAIYVYERGRERLELTNHHGLSIRCSLWDSNVRITDTEKWLSWFDERRISGPRQEVEAMRALRAQNNKDWERWLTAMPKAVGAVWSSALREFGEVDLDPLRSELERSMPDQGERVLALLEWFGSGSGPWSGFPSYETAAENLLLDFSTIDLISATQSRKLSPAQTEGAARLFGGWSFAQQRPEGLKELPDALKKDLWLHTQNTRDKDKYWRARGAFAK
jgi:hypothetical protein